MTEPGAEPAPLTVGVTGHRAVRLHGMNLPLLTSRIRAALTALDLPPSGCVLSPVADGADQIVARAAVALGCRLACVLPFPRHDYLADFPTAAGKAEYNALLSLAECVIELDGSTATPEDRDRAYVAVGAYTVEHCDMLLAIWDGRRARGSGGTAQVVDAALGVGRPVVWISSAPPHTVSILVSNGRGAVTEHPLDDDPLQLRALIAGGNWNRS